jgi:glutamyl-tRNA synthetase
MNRVQNTQKPRVRTRFAPSPTGSLHIGGARTALFAYLWAKHNNGDFLLRVEDTDKVREVPGSGEEQREGLRWLGIQWDEGPEVGGEYGPYKQSERLDIYKEHAQMLLDAGHAYYCFCTPERLNQMRLDQQAQKLPPRYDRHCLSLKAEEISEKQANNEKYVVRLKMPTEGSVIVRDMVRGDLTFQYKDIDDQVLMKSDGYPTYHLANVVDDHLMEITDVIRGEEWLPSTPKHIYLYEVFGWQAPTFTHLTVFLSKKGGKMSKRDGETALLAFRALGYLPEAVVNYSALLGWNPKTEEEFFSMDDLIEKFDLSMLNAGNPIFETEKLDWLNAQYLKKKSVQEFIEDIHTFKSYIEGESLEKINNFIEYFDKISLKKQESIWKSLQERIKKLLDVTTINELLQPVSEYDPALLIWKKSDKTNTLSALQAVYAQFEQFSDDDFVVDTLQPSILEWIKTTEWGNGDVLWPTRYALTGIAQSPSPFEVAEIIGKTETLKRLSSGIAALSKTA